MYTKNSETELKMYPYHKQMKQKLTDNDKQLCVINNSRTDVERVPYSPDLNPPDFYLWGYLKDTVYGGRPQTIDDIKHAIATNIKAIPVQECSSVIDNFIRRIHLCLLQQGSHLEHIL